MMWWIMTIAMAIMSGVLLSGHGAFLIAGYNTSSKEDKAKYDEKKLCRVMGSGLAVITVLLAVMAFFGENIPTWYPKFFGIAVIVDVAILLILSNTRCYAENPSKIKEKSPNEAEAEAAKKRKVMTGSLIFTGIIIIFVCVMLFTGNIEMNYGEESFTIEASYWPDRTIAYEDIESIEMIEKVGSGSRTNGFGSFRLQMGNFRNSQFGNYIRYTYVDSEAAVVLQVNGTAVVLGGKDEESTAEIYQTLKKKTGL